MNKIRVMLMLVFIIVTHGHADTEISVSKYDNNYDASYYKYDNDDEKPEKNKKVNKKKTTYGMKSALVGVLETEVLSDLGIELGMQVKIPADKKAPVVYNAEFNFIVFNAIEDQTSFLLNIPFSMQYGNTYYVEVGVSLDIPLYAELLDNKSDEILYLKNGDLGKFYFGSVLGVGKRTTLHAERTVILEPNFRLTATKRNINNFPDDEFSLRMSLGVNVLF